MYIQKQEKPKCFDIFSNLNTFSECAMLYEIFSDSVQNLLELKGVLVSTVFQRVLKTANFMLTTESAI